MRVSLDGPYTWRRGDLVEHLDRGLCNLEWQIRFPNSNIKHLPSFRSDHSPLYLHFSPPNHGNDHRRPFRFMVAWLTHPNFSNIVNNNWNPASSWSECIFNFQNVVKFWNFNVFRNIHKRKSRIIRHL
ncbi:hypothetical protein Ahy_B05g074848 [Arachis hypogaea]|uniref:Endonuclease/exonuclease/phosphatase domain-containing protein n=1 Tax=Arachis hypogaea TaxID=3818 RepID=A0A444YZY7_ARAHY|nr:hypothetical protein Ahy_B05g074848 [Arachis hypogaea]